MVGRDVRARLHRKHREGFADIFVGAPYAGDAEPGLTPLGEQPLVLPFLLLVLGIGEFVETVGDDKAAAGRDSEPAARRQKSARSADWLNQNWAAPLEMSLESNSLPRPNARRGAEN
jgi:hypothetical protein